MDRKELENRIPAFKKACEARGYPLNDVCIDEAYPGVDSTSLIIKVVAEWVVSMGCSSALDILIDILWETFDEKTRTHIFSIYIYSKPDELHCHSGEIEKTRATQLA